MFKNSEKSPVIHEGSLDEALSVIFTDKKWVDIRQRERLRYRSWHIASILRAAVVLCSGTHGERTEFFQHHALIAKPGGLQPSPVDLTNNKISL